MYLYPGNVIPPFVCVPSLYLSLRVILSVIFTAVYILTQDAYWKRVCSSSGFREAEPSQNMSRSEKLGPQVGRQ